MQISAILTGVTGMVGEGILQECLRHPDVVNVLVINRKPCNVMHPKLKEIIHADFFDITSLKDVVKDYNACFFCLGVSSIGMKEGPYKRITYDLTLSFAETLSQANPGMSFCYISGAGTDSTERGKSMWARVKGKTENDLFKLAFKQVYAFRPAMLQAAKDAKNILPAYKYLGWLFPVLKVIAPKYVSTLEQLGLAMINAVRFGYEKKVLEVKDILVLSQK